MPDILASIDKFLVCPLCRRESVRMMPGHGIVGQRMRCTTCQVRFTLDRATTQAAIDALAVHGVAESSGEKATDKVEAESESA